VTSPLAARLLCGGLAVALLAPAGCSDDEPGEGEARLEVDGEAIVERDGERETVDDDADLGPGDRVEITEGVGRLRLADGVRMELRSGLDDADNSVLLMDRVPVLEAGDLLVAAPEQIAVEAAGTTVDVGAGAARVSRRLGVGVAAYDATVHLDSAGQEREVPALREMQVPALGRPPRAPRPLDYDERDPWDRRILGDAIDLGKRLEAMADGYTQNLDPDEGRTPTFFRFVLPGLADDTELDQLLEPDRPTGETLIGAAITDLGRDDSFPTRWSEVFGFRDQGAEWGLVALDQEVGSTPLVDTIEQAIGSSPLGVVGDLVSVAPGDPGGPSSPASPSSPTGSSGPTTTRSGEPTPTTAPPPPTTSPTPTTPPPTTPPVDPGDSPLVPELEPEPPPEEDPVTDLVGGIVDEVLGPLGL
jgi:hypothetical protein